MKRQQSQNPRQPNSLIININKTYGAELWECINETVLKNKLKAQKMHFHVRYKQYMTSRNRRNASQLSLDRNAEKSRKSNAPRLRDLCIQKNQAKDKLQKTISDYNYHHVEKERTLRSFHIAKQKYNKIVRARQNHLNDQLQLNKSRIANQESIQNEKAKIRLSVGQHHSTRHRSLDRSRVERMEQANQIRLKTQENRIQRYENDMGILAKLRKNYQEERSQERLRTLRSMEVIEIKKREAGEMRMSRMFSEIHQKQVLQRERNNFQVNVSRKICKMRKVTESLNQKIDQFRKFTGEVRQTKRSKSLSMSTQV